jgi:replication initiation and membrane attachment protein DnaB
MKNASILFVFLMALASCSQNKNIKASTDSVKIDATADSSMNEPTNEFAVITFSESLFDFGNIHQGDVVEHLFSFTNTGNTDLLISNANASCGCTVPEFPKEPVKPGATANIKVKFNSEGKEGSFLKQVYIIANTKPNETKIEIKGNILLTDKNDKKLLH